MQSITHITTNLFESQNTPKNKSVWLSNGIRESTKCQASRHKSISGNNVSNADIQEIIKKYWQVRDVKEGWSYGEFWCNEL
jgi:hypothetical protein